MSNNGPQIPSCASEGRRHVNRYPSLRGVQVCFAYLSRVTPREGVSGYGVPYPSFDKPFSKFFDKPFLKVYVCPRAYVDSISRRVTGTQMNADLFMRSFVSSAVSEKS